MYGTSYDTGQNNKSLMCILDGRESLYQWDINIKITCENLQVDDEVHFCNACHAKALVVKAYKLGEKVVADIPNLLLQKDAPIKVWRYIADENSQYTIEEKVFSVISRPQPADYVYEETEVATIYTVVEEALRKAKESGEFDGADGQDGVDGKDGVNGTDGKDGQDGADGQTPYIKDGYWWIGDTNTNVKAEGTDGKDGQNGVDGKGIVAIRITDNGELEVDIE